MSRTVLITGCSSGIGKALLKEFMNKGYFTIASARKPQDVQELKKISSAAIELDVTNQDSVDKAKDQVKELFDEQGLQGLDILVNNAGQGFYVPALDADSNSVMNVFQVNVFGPMRMTNAFTPLLLEAKNKKDYDTEPKIVQIGSIAGIIPFPFGSIYGSTKAALQAYSLGLQTEMELLGIKVIVIYTGGVKSEINDKAVIQSLPPNSYFLDYEKLVIERKQLSQDRHPTSAEDYAKSVVSQVTKRNPWSTIYEGRGSWTAAILSSILPVQWIRVLAAWFLGLYRRRDKLKTN